MARETISTFERRIVGYIDTDSSGNKTVMDFYHKILGYYNRSTNATMTYSRKIIAYGDATGVFFKDDIRF